MYLIDLCSSLDILLLAVLIACDNVNKKKADFSFISFDLLALLIKITWIR